MEKQKVKEVWKKFSEKAGFKMNPDEKIIEMLAEGVLKNEAAHGLKLCPCRIRDGTKERDLELICPCNFEKHDTWSSQGRCWCGLFLKKE